MKEKLWSNFLSIKSLADYLGLSKSYLYNNWRIISEKNDIKFYRIGRKLLFNRKDVDKAMKDNRQLL